MSRKKWVIASLVVLGVVFCLLVPCAVEVRDGEGWVRSAFSLQMVGHGLRAYHDAHGQLPPAVVRDREGRPLYSWRVLLLPYLEEDELYGRFKLDEPWDSPHNKLLALKTPRCYVPALGGEDDPGLTRYQVFVGPGTAFERPGLTWADFPDDRGGTILVAEAGEPVPWSKPADLPYEPDRPLPVIEGPYSKPVHLLCYEVGRKPGFVVCLGNGTTHFLSTPVDEKLMRGLISRNGGEVVDISELE